MDFKETRRWAALAAADPEMAAKDLALALGELSLEDRLEIKDRARRHLVSTLVGLAWRSAAFNYSIKCLALLAEAENETWANNATGEFIARFQIRLGGTAVPYLDRLPVLDDLLALNRKPLSSLVVNALAKAGVQHFSRTSSESASDELPETEWHPNNEEFVDAVKGAAAKLKEIASHANPELEECLVDAVRNFSMMLRFSALSPFISELFICVRDYYPETREALRRSINRIIEHDRRYRNEMSVEHLETLELLHSEFEDESIKGRLYQYVGPENWGSQERPDLTAIAQELINNLSVLKTHWHWLTSGEAGDAWRLGEKLAELDIDSELAEKLPGFPDTGRDNRLLCGYLQVKRMELGDEWFDQWVQVQYQQQPLLLELLFEVAWRCGATDLLASMVAEMIRSYEVSPNIVGQLSYGSWGDQLGADQFLEIMLAMKEFGHEGTAASLLDSRLRSKPEDAPRFKELALKFVLMPSLIKSSHMDNYHWKELADPLVKDNAREIASEIFKAQADRDGEYWSLMYTEALNVLNSCVDIDPSGVWQELQGYLDSRISSAFFSVGFPKDLLDKIPPDDVLKWVKENPEENAEQVARLASKDLSSDELLTSRLLGEYADLEDVGNTFFSEFWSGSWTGPSSMHWDELGSKLEEVVGRTKLPKLRTWAAESARAFRKMAEDERKREEEEDLRGR